MNVLIGFAAWAAALALIVRVVHVATAGNDDHDDFGQIPVEDPVWHEFLNSHPEMTP